MKYEIKGEPFPVVECTVADGETLKCQAGAMAWMTGNMEMATKSGGLGKMLGRLATNEALFENNYTAKGGEGMIAFATNVPGHILPIDLNGGRVIIAQKGSFLASEMSVNVEKHFQKKGMGGLLGGFDSGFKGAFKNIFFFDIFFCISRENCSCNILNIIRKTIFRRNNINSNTDYCIIKFFISIY